MKTSLYLIIVILGISSSLSAQNSSQGGSDAAAKSVLDKVSAKFKTFKAVQSNFSLLVEDKNGKIQGNKKGTVLMKGAKYRVNITGQEIFCDGKNIWTFDKSSNEVTIATVTFGLASLALALVLGAGGADTLSATAVLAVELVGVTSFCRQNG